MQNYSSRKFSIHNFAYTRNFVFERFPSLNEFSLNSKYFHLFFFHLSPFFRNRIVSVFGLIRWKIIHFFLSFFGIREIRTKYSPLLQLVEVDNTYIENPIVSCRSTFALKLKLHDCAAKLHRSLLLYRYNDRISRFCRFHDSHSCLIPLRNWPSRKTISNIFANKFGTRLETEQELVVKSATSLEERRKTMERRRNEEAAWGVVSKQRAWRHVGGGEERGWKCKTLRREIERFAFRDEKLFPINFIVRQKELH